MYLVLAYCARCKPSHVAYMVIVSEGLLKPLVDRWASNPAISAIVVTEI